MKLLYIAALPMDFENLDGVPKKIVSQCKALGTGFDVDLIYYFQGRVYLRTVADGQTVDLGTGRNKLDVLRLAAGLVGREVYRSMYIRYPRADYLLLRLLKSARKARVRVAMEIPTYPYNMEGNESLRGRVVNVLDKLFRNRLWPYVDRIVTYSDDWEIFQIPTIRTINGVDFDMVACDTAPVDVRSRIDLIAVSAMYRVHGYDRLIRGLHNYYSAGGKRNVVLKLVGKGDAYDGYRQLVETYNLQDHVIFCGQCFGEQLDEVYRGNAVGINSLAIHRQGLTKESTLKTKEYAAKGLPILSSSYVDAFSEEGNRSYAMVISPDETPVDVEKLIEFVDGIYLGRPLEEIRRDIREDGRKTCDVHTTMRQVREYLLGN